MADDDEIGANVSEENNAYLGPSVIRSLDDKAVTQISCRGEHCVAISATTGMCGCTITGMWPGEGSYQLYVNIEYLTLDAPPRFCILLGLRSQRSLRVGR